MDSQRKADMAIKSQNDPPADVRFTPEAKEREGGPPWRQGQMHAETQEVQNSPEPGV